MLRVVNLEGLALMNKATMLAILASPQITREIMDRVFQITKIK